MLERAYGRKAPYPIPDSELERRWAAVRAVLAEEGADVLLVSGATLDSGGYVRWFTDIPPNNPSTVLFPRTGGMTWIASGNPERPGPAPELCRGIATRLSAPFFRTIHCTERYDADLAVKALKDLGAKRIGFCNLGRMDASFYRHLVDGLPGREFVDLTDRIDAIKAVKSEAELVYVRAAMDLHDKVLEATTAFIRPGRVLGEVRNDVYHLACELGSEGQMVLLLGSAPMGTPCIFGPFPEQNRRIEQGDHVLVMLESSGPGGFFAEMGRYWCLGEPPRALVHAWDAARAAALAAADACRAGVSPMDPVRAANAVLADRGYGPEGRILGHGQGYDYMEPPALLPDERLRLAPGMNLAIHTTAASPEANAFSCDNYLVQPAGGATRMQRMPQELIVL